MIVNRSAALLGSLLLCTSVSLGADWIRYPAISPDGKAIAFSYRGDLWKVGRKGGRAQLLTTHEAYERSPVWTPDSKSLAFASDRHGNFDVFVISSAGGKATRVTYHSSDDTPSAFDASGEEILFASNRQDAPQAAIGLSRMGELYRIPAKGGRPRQILTTPAEDARPSPDGRYIVYHDYKGYEDPWRKHHVSAIARDIWIYDTETGTHRKLTSFRGEDRNPVWSSDGRQVYFLSERDGTFNVWKLDPFAESPEPEQITHHETNPVRFLSMADDGTLCYGWNGQVWIKSPEADPVRVKIRLQASERRNPVKFMTLKDGATEMAVSPNEEEIAFIVRGEVFVTSVEYDTTKRITNTPEQERNVAWGKDGRTLFYASERDGSWNLYQTTITREEEGSFSVATLLTEEVVLAGEAEMFQGVPSPDGKKMAYLHNRDEIRLLDLETKQTSTLVPARLNYSYSDGDIEYDWSPDSRWLAFTYNASRRWLQDVGVVNIATGKITNISNSGYSEQAPAWSADGKALLFMSDRLGRRNHGSWGSDDDIFGFYLTTEHWNWINLSKEDWERQKKRDEKKDKADEKKKEKKAGDDEASENAVSDNEEDAGDKEEVEPLKVDLADPEYRTKRLTLHSAPMGGFDLSPDGETLVYFAQEENKWDLWISRIRTQSTSKLASLGSDESGTVVFGKDGEQVFVRHGGKLAKVSVPESGSGKVTSISYSAGMELEQPAEREYLFEHVWRQVKRKFYREDLHGVDWEALKQNYAAFLPSIQNNHDFAEMLSEMLGELNASHTGARYRPKSGGDSTASLGLLFDVDYEGAGLKVAEVLKRGPADKEDSRIKAGVIITHIDGVRLTENMNPYPLFNRKAGQRVRLGLTDPDANEDWEEVIKAASRAADGPLLYERWVAGRHKLVEELSEGRLGYVHVKGMDDPSFRRVYRDVLGRDSDKEALIVDTRYNGGGWLHDDLVSFLSGEDYIYFKPRGKEVGDFGAEPAFRWSRPVVVLQSESNYSDAHMFPYAFKQLKMGKLVGTPVAGTGTAVWWERLIDPTLVFGIPQVGMVTPDGNYLENTELQPDVEVYNSPESVARGEDQQLAKAVGVLLEELDQ